MTLKTCMIDGCAEPVEASRLCRAHKNRRSNYPGLSHDRFAQLLKETACEICGRTDQELVIDHHHGEGHVRGMLCRGCNNALGTVEKTEWVLAAQDYLARHARGV